MEDPESNAGGRVSGSNGQGGQSRITEPQMKMSYASTTELSTLPKKDQAIIIEAIEGLTLDDYVDGLEDLIDFANVGFMSKISGSPVCVFLSSKQGVERLKNETVIVKDRALTIKPLLSIRIVSNITNIRASLSKPGRAHIGSLRRQFYIKEEDEKNLPENLHISFDNSTH
ncbi:hypothetical protein QAD02_021223 [Eretmocerus hayati]|uniref:Uncharacterized protein n=1 Tax=Eretmocerus hayati TaxID=131215 RepID=A0ACC2PPV0_9HYME|nr:hypothetical protein QAD02_021223 [Eretmocerus hayati]